MGRGRLQEAETMKLHIDTAIMSEFVEDGEIRHHWKCDACGQPFRTSIPLTTH
jgi:hypothetical protein